MSKIAYFRKKRQLTQKELADLSGVSRSRIVEIEHNKGDMTSITLMLLAKALNVSPNDLLDWEYFNKKSIDELKYLFFSNEDN